MSDTPLTDDALTGDSGGLWSARRIENFIAHARSLERRLRAAEKCVEALGHLRDGIGMSASYCDMCDRHAPKDIDGNLLGGVEHEDDCPYCKANDAIQAYDQECGKGAGT